MTPNELNEKVRLLRTILSLDYDWTKHDWEKAHLRPDSLFRSCIKVHCWDSEGNGPEIPGKVSCGSWGAKSYDENGKKTIHVPTPVALYRLLFLCEPKHVPFDDMYKCGLWLIQSACERYLAVVELFKYELGLYFYAPKEEVTGRRHVAQGGWPGCDNGIKIASEDGEAFFRMLTEAVLHEWDVYSGNDFKV